MIDDSADLKRLIVSPVFSADDQFKAISAILDEGRHFGPGRKLPQGRCRQSPSVCRSRHDQGLTAQIAARHRGEISAEVTSAHALTAAQETELKAALKSVTGKDVTVNVTVDPSILGGLIVKVGSRQIDTSLRTKLSTLKLALKEVG